MYQGLSQKFLEDYETAIISFNKVLEFSPGKSGAYYAKACCYALQSKINSSIENLQQAINLDSEYQKAAKTDPDFDSIRTDIRFQKLIQGR